MFVNLTCPETNCLVLGSHLLPPLGQGVNASSDRPLCRAVSVRALSVVDDGEPEDKELTPAVTDPCIELCL